MAEFTSITFEVQISGVWVDLTADVMEEPAPHFTRGTRGTGILDRVADPGRLTFSLDNSIGNSAGLAGYYSPTHANKLTGWGPSLPVRVTFTWDEYSIVKFFGRIEPDGLKISVGTKGERRCHVTAVDFMGICSNHKMDLVTASFSKFMGQGIALVLANLPIQPQEVDYSYLSTVQRDIFDVSTTQTTASAEFQKFAQTWDAHIVVRGGSSGEVLYPFNGWREAIVGVATASSDTLLTEAGDDFIFEDGDSWALSSTATASTITDADMLPGTELSYGAQIYNTLTQIVTPRRVDTTNDVVLWTMEGATEIPAASSITIRASYRDPNGAARINGQDLLNPVRSTDYFAYDNEAGSGTDYSAYLDISYTATPGAAEAELLITNTHPSIDLYTGGEDILCQIRGRGVYTYDAIRVVSEYTPSIDTYGVRPFDWDWKYTTSLTSDEFAWSTSFFGYFALPGYQFERIALCANRSATNMAWFLFLEPGDFVYCTDAQSAAAGNAYIVGYDVTINSGMIVNWALTTKRIGDIT